MSSSSASAPFPFPFLLLLASAVLGLLLQLPARADAFLVAGGVPAQARRGAAAASTGRSLQRQANSGGRCVGVCDKKGGEGIVGFDHLGVGHDMID
jgi:hypothetical protein